MDNRQRKTVLVTGIVTLALLATMIWFPREEPTNKKPGYEPQKDWRVGWLQSLGWLSEPKVVWEGAECGDQKRIPLSQPRKLTASPADGKVGVARLEILGGQSVLVSGFDPERRSLCLLKDGNGAQCGNAEKPIRHYGKIALRARTELTIVPIGAVVLTCR